CADENRAWLSRAQSRSAPWAAGSALGPARLHHGGCSVRPALTDQVHHAEFHLTEHAPAGPRRNHEDDSPPMSRSIGPTRSHGGDLFCPLRPRSHWSSTASVPWSPAEEPALAPPPRVP